eukprot:26246-Rhodomonas_salina.1
MSSKRRFEATAEFMGNPRTGMMAVWPRMRVAVRGEQPAMCSRRGLALLILVGSIGLCTAPSTGALDGNEIGNEFASDCTQLQVVRPFQGGADQQPQDE